MLKPGQQVERYVVDAVLGEGGMAVVYRVRHSTLGSLHALKVLTLTKRDVVDRLLQEGRLQATIRHPNIVAVSDVLEIEGHPALLMEYVEGPSLDRWLLRYQPPLDEALHIFRGILSGVAAAHARGILHRDLKPANVLLDVQDDVLTPKVTDFGLAKATGAGDLRRTRSGTTMGTPAYMAPEQIRDASKVDQRADLYSLGCILYELCCHRPPYIGEDIIELFNAVSLGQYPAPRTVNPDLPDDLGATVQALMQVDPSRRLPDCKSLSGRLSTLTGIKSESGRILPMKAPAGAEAARTIAAALPAGRGPTAVPGGDLHHATWSDADLEAAAAPAEVDLSLGPRASGFTTTTAPRRTFALTVGALVGITLVATVGVVLGAAVLLWLVSPYSPLAGPTVAAAPPPPVQAVTPEDEPEVPLVAAPEVASTVTQPEVIELPPVAEKVVEEPIAAKATRPRTPPKPPEKAPEKVAEPASGSLPAPTTASFAVTGDARNVWLIGADGTGWRTDDALPPGTYRIKAWFSGRVDPVLAAELTLEAGDKATIHCVQEAFSCTRAR